MPISGSGDPEQDLAPVSIWLFIQSGAVPIGGKRLRELGERGTLA